MNKDLGIFSIPQNSIFTDAVCKYIGVKKGELVCKTFADGELWCKFDNVRGGDIFIIGSTNPPAENIMMLCFAIDAAKRASADRITAVIPYFGYARQERKREGRVPISAKTCADLFTAAGAHRVLTMDLHAGAIEGFFDFPVDHLYGGPALLEKVVKEVQGDIAGVAPDTGASSMVRNFCKLYKWPLIIIDKRREEANQIDEINVLGKAKDKICLIIDDMIDTAGTITQVAQGLMAEGAKEVYAMATHGILSEPALERINQSPITKLWVSDSNPLVYNKIGSKIEVISVAPVFGEAIRRIHNTESLSSMFPNGLTR